MQDDTTWKLAKAVVDLAKIVAGKDVEMKEKYGCELPPRLCRQPAAATAYATVG
jgi:hypothetical protein